MNSSHRTVALLVVTLAALAGGGATRAADYCQTFPTLYDWSGWQTPGAGTGSGTWGCQAGSSNTVVTASQDAYFAGVRKTPELANFRVRLSDFNMWGVDGNADDALSLLLHWHDPVLPSGCCERVHAASGLRVVFSLARNAMEVYQEVNGQSAGPVATLPFTLTGGLRDLAVAYRGTLLTLEFGGTLIGTVEVPITPPGRFGFEVRRMSALIVPALTIDCTAPGDYDCDGVPDAADNCPQNINADQQDLDGDGAGDACDLDDDGDGVPDLDDACPAVADPGQVDTDGDGLGDACDPCPTDPSNDVDADGVCGSIDTCPGTANADQADFDGDGQGDLCDTNDGLLVLRWDNTTRLAWQYDTGYAMYDLYRGDMDVLRATGVYVQDPRQAGPLALRSCNLRYAQFADSLQPPVGKVAFYHVTGARDGLEAGLGTDSAGVERPNGDGCFADCDQRFTTILNAFDGPATEQYLVIDNLTDWCAFRPSACGSGLVDFATEVAVVAALGVRYSSCEAVAIGCMRHEGGNGDLEVVTEEWFPGAGCACFAVLTQPMSVARVPRPSGAVNFRIESQTLICP